MRWEFVSQIFFKKENFKVTSDILCKDITDDKVEIKLDSHPEKKTSTKFRTLRKKLGRQKVQEIEDKSEESTEWFKVSDISFREPQTMRLPVSIF